MPEDQVVRLTFDITKSLHNKLCIIPHGMRKHAYKALMERFATQLEKNPGETIHNLLADKLPPGTVFDGKVPDGSKE